MVLFRTAVLILFAISFSSATLAGYMNVAVSGTDTIITYPGPDHNATLAGFTWPGASTVMTKVAEAQWVWHGTGIQSGCPMTIRVKHTFSIACIGKPLILYVSADNLYTSDLLGTPGSGSDWSVFETYSVPTTNIACGDPLTIYINATNIGSDCAGNPAGLSYAVICPDCSNCSYGNAYDPSACGCSPCSKNLTSVCTSCTSMTNCLTCTNNSYAISGGQCTLCSTLNTGCLTCSSPSTCLSCNTTGNIYVMNGSLCASCSALMSNCLTCSIKSSCLTCASGFTPNGTGCGSCPTLMTGCITCSSTTVCTSCNAAGNFGASGNVCACNSGYALSGTSCQYCNVTLSNCAVCSSKTVCTTCLTGYTVSSSTCVACSATLVGCLACSSTSVCTSCNTAGNFVASGNVCICGSGYALSGTNCQLCNVTLSNCSTCSSKTTCTACVSGYAVNGLTCSSCPSMITGCVTCNSNLMCTSCNAGGNFVSNGNVCACNTGYALSGTSCQYCNVTLSNCNICSSTSVCTTCVTGYMVNTTTCSLCSAFLVGCLQCSSKTVCTLCDTANNFLLSGNNCICNNSYALNNSQCTVCVSFLTACLTCSSTSACLSCSNTHALNNSVCSTCVTFLTACATCSSTVACTSCLNNSYTLSNSICRPCGDFLVGCLQCSSNSTCVTCNVAGNFGLATGKCGCNVGYAINGSSCQLCNASLTACTTCNSITACTACTDTSYALSSGICSKCTTFMVGCLNCSSLNTCVTCNASKYFVLSGSQCVCQVGYTLYGTQCKPCSTFLSACTTCNSTTVCTTCTNDNALYHNSCWSCNIFLAGCLNCSNSTSCLVCDTTNNFVLANGLCVCASGYAINGSVCRTCDAFMAGCVTCSSRFSCTSCLTSGNFVLNGTSCACQSGYALTGTTCSTCPSLMDGCLLCSSRSVCTSCDTSNMYLLNSAGICFCQDGYYFLAGACPACSVSCLTCRGTSTNCTSCSKGSYLQNGVCITCAPGCLNCTSPSNCSSCGVGFNLQSGICACNNGTYLDGQVCKDCHATCLTCSDGTASGCTSCSELLFRVLANGSCPCNSTNYKQQADVYPSCKIINTAWCQPYEYWNTSLSACKQICGDGKVYVLECDDGNLLNGDGCSSECTIEPKFTCVNGSTSHRSMCSYTAPLQLKLTSTEKLPKENTLVFTLDVHPPLTSLAGLSSFKNIIQTSLNNTSIEATYKNGTLTVSVKYTENVQGKACSIYLVPPSSSNALFAVQQSQIDLTVLPENNQAALYFDNSTYQLQNKTDTVMTVTQTAGLTSMGAGLIVTKSLSLQLTSVLQTGFLGLSTVNNVNPILASLYQLKYMNGYNNMMKDLGFESYFNQRSSSSRRLLQTTATDLTDVTNTRLSALGYKSAHLIMNFNYMYMAIVAILVIFGSIWLLGRCAKSEKTMKVAGYFLRDILFTVLFFCVNNMAFCLGIQFRYLLIGQVWDAPLIISWIVAISSLLMLIGYLVFYCRSYVNYSDFHEKFKDDKLSQLHYPILISCRYLLSFFAAYFNEYPQFCYGVFVFELMVKTYIAAKQPYKEVYFNVIAIINESVIVLVSAGNCFYRLVDFSDPTAWYSGLQTVPSWIQVVLLGVSVVANYVGMAIYIYKKCCSKKNDIHPVGDGSVDSPDHKNFAKEYTEQESVDKLRTSNSHHDSPKHKEKAHTKHPKEEDTRYAENFVADPNALVDFESDELQNDSQGYIREVQKIELGIGSKNKPKKIRTKKSANYEI